MMWTVLRQLVQKHQRSSQTFHIYERFATVANLSKLAERVRTALLLVSSRGHQRVHVPHIRDDGRDFRGSREHDVL